VGYDKLPFHESYAEYSWEVYRKRKLRVSCALGAILKAYIKNWEMLWVLAVILMEL
jgi:hypothetical protein